MGKKFYDIAKTINRYPDAVYYVAYGERSNGKTYSALMYALDRYKNYGEHFAYVRRFAEDIKKKNVSNLFSSIVENGELKKMGNFKTISYSGNTFLIEKNEEEPSSEIIGYAFDLNSMEHYKSISFPKVTTIIFDEFMSRQGYIPNEFVLFMNTISTIVRDRNNVKILMLGNTVNKYCPYFGEMGLSHIKEQRPGKIDVYRYGDSELVVICEYCESSSKYGGKKSDVYFAFDNPHLQMITTGSWEIGVYPHLNKRYRPKDIVFNFFVDFDNIILHCELVATEMDYFLFIHQKTTPIKFPETDIIYSDRPHEEWNYRLGMNYTDQLTKTILKMLAENRIFYSSNDVGEVFRNYIKWSEKTKVHRGDML